MDQADPVILSVRPGKIPLLEFETADGYRYTTDLSKFESVYCFPKDQTEWENVWQESGDRIVWANRFEIHVDQAVANAIKKEKTTSKAS